MIVGLISDSHDNLPMVRAAVRAFGEAGAQAIIHAGDIIAPFAAKELLKACVPIHAVFGNNDGEKKHLAETLEDIEQAPRRLEIAGRIFLVTHDRNSVSETDLEGVDVFVYGHSHGYSVEPGPPLTVNPGESGGWISGMPTIAVLDTETLEISKIDLTLYPS